MGFRYSDHDDFVADAEAARDDAKAHLRGQGGAVRQRPCEFHAVCDGDRLTEAGTRELTFELATEWVIVQAEIQKLLDEFPHATQIYLEGGYDWAASRSAFDDFDYTPWAGEWAVVVWDKEF